MSAVVHFVPWMRRGVAGVIASDADRDGVPRAGYATIDATVSVAGTDVTRAIRVRGPGAVIGLAPQQIVRREPRAGTSDFETNYFAAIELVSPDLPWMFTPAAPKANKLMPWLVLVVVEQREGISLGARAGAPREVLAIDDARRELPSLPEAWAWAHVQVTGALDGDVATTFAATPEAFVARLVCPRRLVAGTRYLACVVPSFEQGRRAGLGLAIDAEDVALAWNDATVSLELPVYDSWSFRTAQEPGDFEELVKRLRARTLAGDVGVRDLEIGEPGTTQLPAQPNTLVSYRGALLSPSATSVTWDAAHRSAFQAGLRTMLDATLVAAPADPEPYDARRDDPVIGPPVYGALPAQVDAVPTTEHWLAEANLDPVHRGVAGLGAEAIRLDQEALAAEAWDQAAALRQVNRALGRARLALEVSRRRKLRIDSLDDGSLLQISRGAHARIKGTGMTTTLQGRLAASALPAGLVSGAMRRRVRPGTTVARAIARSTTAAAPFASKLTRQFVANPTAMLGFARFTVPHGTVFSDETKATAEPPADVVAELRGIDVDTAFGLGAGGAQLARLDTHAVSERGGLSIEGRAAARTSLPVSGDPVRLLVSPIAIVADEAASELELTDAAALVRERLDPEAALRLRVRSLITAPSSAWGTEAVPDRMTFSPTFARPAYELLVRMNPELMCPGASSIPANTVGLATLNAGFVEAFLLGANHELARELVWREVPVDPADTWMRSFWDSVDDSVEDIAKVSTWRSNPLGTHQPPGALDPSRVLALIVKGELLRRYPNTLVYAVPAIWAEDVDERIEDPNAAQLHPIFIGSLGDDITFLGFEFDVDDIDLDIAGSAARDDKRPGWFFVFEQPATEPRFGLDIGDESEAGGKPALWKNVSWFHALGDASASATHVPIATLDGVARKYDDMGENTWSETWGRDAAAMARVTLQRPVRVLLHADQMLRVKEES